MYNNLAKILARLDNMSFKNYFLEICMKKLMLALAS